MSRCTMYDMDVNDCAKVKCLDITGSMRRRLREIGLIEGTEIKCLQKSPFGDPIAFKIRGCVIALRSDDCKKIKIM